MRLLDLFGPKTGRNSQNGQQNTSETTQKRRKTGRPTKETLLERKLTELKAARTDLLLLEIEAKRRRLQAELAGDSTLTATTIQQVTRYLGDLGFEIKPKESLAGDDWKSIVKAAATGLAPVLLRGITEQSAASAVAPVTFNLPGLQSPPHTEQEPRLAAPTFELPSDVAPFAKMLVGRTPREAAAIIAQAIPPALRSQLGSAVAVTADHGGLDKVLQKIADANPAFNPLVTWLRGEREWLEATGQELKAILERQDAR